LKKGMFWEIYNCEHDEDLLGCVKMLQVISLIFFSTSFNDL
jgi:hypothetical protein